MARTPLWRRLTRLFRGVGQARRTAGQGPPALELMEAGRAAAAQRGPTRRALLASGALAGAALVAGCGPTGKRVAPPAPRRTGPRVAIVGAGIAGLACAHRLLAHGVADVTVYEASARLGGRVLSDRKSFAPLTCELGGELIDSGHSTMLALAQELDIPLHDYAGDDAADPVLGWFGGQMLRERDVLEGFQPIAAAIDRALAKLTDPEERWVSHDAPNGGEALDALSIAGWLDSVGASGPVRKLLEVAYEIEYGLPADRSSALNLLLMISTELDRFEPFGSSDERYHAIGGNDLFVHRLGERVGAAHLELGTRLEALRPAGAGGGLALTLTRGGSARDVQADHVVLALPFTMLRKCSLHPDLGLPPAQRRAIAELGMGQNAKLMVGFSSRPWRAAGSSGETFTDLAYQSTWETSRMQPGPAGIITNFVGGAQALAIGAGTAAAQATAFLAGFEQLFPGVTAAAAGRVARFHWPSYPLTEGSYSAYLVGQYVQMAGITGRRAGRLHFCGEHTSVEAQGFMEGGAATGQAAADEVLGDLGVRPPAARAHRPAARSG